MRINGFRNKLIVKLLGAVAISFFVSIGMMTLIIEFILRKYRLNFLIEYPTKFGVFKYNLLLIFLFSIAIFIFMIAFLLIVKKKLVYLKHITKGVHDISSGKLGSTIEVVGKDELTLLAQNINYMSKELENKFEHERQLESTKNELITNVSHDLRTPLTSIIGYLDLLKKGQYDTKIQYQDYLETIYSKSQRLKYLIDELFEYTRLSSPDVKLNLNEVDLTGLLEQITGEYIPIFEKENLNVQKSIPEENICLLMDVEMMVRVYENLFMNAIKYSVKPSEIQISLEVKGSKAVLKVSNKVKKPPVDDLTKLFERSFRGDKARMDNRGTGLGLAISKRIVELHNGVIGAEYKEGWIIFIVEHPISR
ncbi:HAMP domain-containing histidine kinase [Peribacillus muralis]|uniref:HAMP domain-containing sensor histidine kinase n=1 Tax=Peribacillus muralis TaxID=264697 RepID=UPI001F4DF822|nr:HAMP domain-containing sensor histidine kinase [Peribacillus muralis]MCK1995555.1 HAMP domain-containing histidine kinase [Peribacillus muralis]MCK2016111.1 HAMP domain-containing histidine kinase [Peribacillus muralis]